MSTKKPSEQGNQGIQIRGGNITAEVIAVGSNAQAIKSGVPSNIDQESFQQLLGMLRTTLEMVVPNPNQRSILEKEVNAVAAEGKKAEPNRDSIGGYLVSFVDKVKLLNTAADESAKLLHIAKKIALAAGMTLSFLA